MSSEAPMGLSMMEKLIGLLLIVIGALSFYTSYNMTGVGSASILFLAASFVLILVGIVLVTARTE